MSYCRFGDDSDVYVYYACKGLCCCMCFLNSDREDEHFHKRSEMINHLKQHKKRGHKVPPRAMKRLKEEIAEEQDFWKTPQERRRNNQ